MSMQKDPGQEGPVAFCCEVTVLSAIWGTVSPMFILMLNTTKHNRGVQSLKECSIIHQWIKVNTQGLDIVEEG